MKKVTLLTNATVASMLVATAIAAPAFACHPVGSIIKVVQDQTTGSDMVDANTESSTLSVNSGDTLVYSITVKNSGAYENNGDDDMSNVTLTDTLPSGIQLISNPSQTAVNENLGTIKPGNSITKTYAVKVTDTMNGATITNTACYTGKSANNQDDQQGCDTAVVKVKILTPAPTAQPKQTPTPTPTTPTTPTAPTTLPDTGSTALSATLFIAGAAFVGYMMNVLRIMLRSND